MSLHEAAAALDKLIYGSNNDGNHPLRIERPELKKRCNLELPNGWKDESDVLYYKSVKENVVSDLTPKAGKTCWDPFLKKIASTPNQCMSVETWRPGSDKNVTTPQATASEQQQQQFCIPLSIEDQHYSFSTSANVSEIENFLPCNAIFTPKLFIPSSASSVVKQYSDNFSNVSKFEIATVSTSASTDDFSPLDPTKYKTELCRSYQVHGICKYGLRCNYAHGLNQLKVAFRHGKYKTRNCQSYHETGFCRYGARCSFIHDPEEGILKCPITEREVLEALHYRPLAEYHHHVAAITWRVLGTKLYPPTELHFFTPASDHAINWNSSSSLLSDDDISSESSSSAMLLNDGQSLDSQSGVIDAGNTLEREELQKYFIDQRWLPPTDTIIQPILVEPFKSNDTSDELSLCISQEGELDSVKPSADITRSSTEDDKVSLGLTGNEIKDSKSSFILKDSFMELNSMARDTYFRPSIRSKDSILDSSRVAKLNNASLKPCRYYGRNRGLNSCVEKNNIFISGSFKSFKLEDFLRCLKTREDQHHLATRAPENEKKCPLLKAESLYPQPRNPETPPFRKETFSRGIKDMSKFKTELCRSFQYNQYCEYGESCLYAHGTQDLRLYPKHPMYRTKKCFSFHHKGFCLYGSRCQFLHDIE